MAKVNSISRSGFKGNAKPLTVTGKADCNVGLDKERLQIGMNVTIVGSKELPKETAKPAGSIAGIVAKAS